MYRKFDMSLKSEIQGKHLFAAIAESQLLNLN